MRTQFRAAFCREGCSEIITCRNTHGDAAREGTASNAALEQLEFAAEKDQEKLWAEKESAKSCLKEELQTL